MNKALYIVFTPYQLLLASSVVRQTGQEADLLLIQETITAAMRADAAAYFRSVEVIGFQYPNKQASLGAKLQTYLAFYKQVKQRYQNSEYATVAASSEGSLLVRMVLAALPKTYAYWHVEDGSFDYSQYIERKTLKEEIITYYLRLATFDFTIKNKATTPGTATWIARRFFTNPDLVRHEIVQTNQKCERIALSTLQETMQYYARNLNELHCDVLLCLDHSESSTNCDSIFNAIVKQCQDNNLRVAIKYHPRETNFYIQYDAIQVDPKISIELQLAHFSGTLIAGASTVMLSSQLLYPHQKRIYVGNLVSYHTVPTQLAELIASFSIPFASSVEQCTMLLK
ncbi:MAG: polysialyltransferase family glycosyltransferase [Erysipelotrichaceae bacterium]